MSEPVNVGGALVSEPVRVDDPDSCAWDAAADVVVVGFGAAGAAAAIQVVQHGGSALVLDRFQGGGATTLSGGIIYAGGGTRQQLDAGVRDDPDNMFRYLSLETQGSVSDECLREFCNGSVAMMNWLEGLGLEFKGTLSPIKTSYPSQPYFLYYSGNEGLPASAEHATPAPRGHRHVAKGQAGGTLYRRLKAAAVRAGVTAMLQTRVRRLVLDGQHRVIGVEAEQMPPGTLQSWLHAAICRVCNGMGPNGVSAYGLLRPLLEKLERDTGVKKLIRARRGVILATGGYVMSPAMRKTYLTKYEGAMPNGAPSCDGSGILLGESVGGATRMMDHASAWRFINPPWAFAKAPIVNARGERFCNEGAYGARIGRELVQQPDGKAWLVLDQKLFDQARFESRRGRAWLFQSAQALLTMYFNRKKAATIGELAAACGIDAHALSSTIDQYNRIVRGEVPDPFRKNAEYLSTITEAPFYALNISVDSKTFPLAVISFGGLEVDERTSQVRRADGTLIENLYAVGRTAAGIPSNNYMSGFAIADCIFTGRRAANAVMANQPAEGRAGANAA
ncbi:MAG: delta 4,5-alpha steroid dehydrogenase [Deltaproteobacteria bacterium]|nr:delta 4,5-alpha steroid dehydrogenase [Deltaproteobacteria bacterium]